MRMPLKAPMFFVALLFFTGKFTKIECGEIFDAPSLSQSEILESTGARPAKLENPGDNRFLKFLDNLFGLKPENTTAEPKNVPDFDDVVTPFIDMMATHEEATSKEHSSESEETPATQSEGAPVITDKPGKPYNATEYKNWLEQGLKSLDSKIHFSKELTKAVDMTAVDPPTTVDSFTTADVETQDNPEPTPLGAPNEENGATNEGHPLIEQNVPKFRMNFDSFGQTFRTINEDSIPSGAQEDGKKSEILEKATTDNDEEMESTSERENSATPQASKHDESNIFEISAPPSVPVVSVPPKSVEIATKMENPQKSLKTSSEMSKSSEHQNPSNVNLVDSIFCRAKCVEQCVTINHSGFKECQAQCKTFSLENLCAQDDAPCLTACSLNAINHNLAPPNITQVTYFTKDEMMDPETMLIFWDRVPGAVLYLVSLVADSGSIQAGADYLIQDITDKSWYSFKKPELCYQYYASVSAVLSDGITPFSQPVFQLSAVRNISDLEVGQKEVAFTNLMRNEFSQARFVDVILGVFSHAFFDLGKIQLTSYLLASQCDMANDRTAIFGHSLGGSDKKVAVTNVQFLHAQQKIIVRLPLDVVAMNCKFEYRIAYMKTRCGNIISYVSNIGTTYDSIVGTDFRLNCDTAPFEGCGGIPSINDIEEPVTESTSSESAGEGVSCNLEDFKVDILGSASEGGYNLTVSWDTINDAQPKTYLLSHGSAQRKLVQEPPLPSDLDYTPEPQISVFTDALNDPSRMFVKLNRALPLNDLHVFQLCVVRVGVPLTSVNWAKAPKRVVDMAAIPAPSEAELPAAADIGRAIVEGVARWMRPDVLEQPLEQPLVQLGSVETPAKTQPLGGLEAIEARLMGLLPRPDESQVETIGPQSPPDDVETQVMNFLARAASPQVRPVNIFRPMGPMNRPDWSNTQFSSQLIGPNGLQIVPIDNMMGHARPNARILEILTRPALPQMAPVNPWARPSMPDAFFNFVPSSDSKFLFTRPSDPFTGPNPPLERVLELAPAKSPSLKDMKKFWASFFDDVETKVVPTAAPSSRPARQRLPDHDQLINVFGYQVEEEDFLQAIFGLIFVISVISAVMFFCFALRKCCMKKRVPRANKNPLIFVQHSGTEKKPVAYIDVENQTAQTAK